MVSIINPCHPNKTHHTFIKNTQLDLLFESDFPGVVNVLHFVYNITYKTKKMRFVWFFFSRSF